MSVEKMEFKTETKQLLDLMIHSLYSHKEIFLREIISNASDAIDKAKFESLTNDSISEGDKEWKIRITPDKEKNTITISDNGIGLTREQAVNELGTIAHSGTKEFVKAMQKKDAKENTELIGQFGVGFYSAFMVSDKVTVVSRKAGSGDKKGIKWESTADGSYTVEDIEKDTKGTDIIIHLKEDEKNFLEEWEIKSVVKKYSDFIEYPVVMEVEREKDSTIDKTKKIKVKEDETLNSQKAIWLKSKDDIKEEEYNEFYKHLSHDFTNPANTVHYKAEGTSEFTALLYIPSKSPMDILYKEYKTGLTLYVKRVKIMEFCEELIPAYLRFVKGVTDSSDLPLNVSREILQNNKQMEVIKSSITKKILDTLSDMKKKDHDKYLIFYNEFGRILKEGIHFDFKRKEKIAELLLFPSTATEKDKFTDLTEYVAKMQSDQKEIYYVTATTLTEALSSPYLESFKEKGIEVLIMLDDVDDIILGNFEYKEKKFKSVARGEIAMDETAKEEKVKADKKFKKLIDLIKNRLKDDIKEVRVSSRLKDSPCCLVVDEGAMDKQMENMLRSMGQPVPENKRILEINPTHPIIESMNVVFEKDAKQEVLTDYSTLLYDQALLLEGSKPKDATAFARNVSKLMVQGIGAR